LLTVVVVVSAAGAAEDPVGRGFVIISGVETVVCPEVVLVVTGAEVGLLI
jgi:hypothetical protein